MEGNIKSGVLSLKERLEELNALCEALKRIHPSLEYKGVNIDLLRGEYEKKVDNTKDNEEFYDLLREFLAPINDSHTKLEGVPRAEGPKALPIQKAEIITHKWLEDRIGYIKVVTFNGIGEREFVIKFDAALEEFRDSRAMILDVRGNPGGSDVLGDLMNGRFTEEAVVSSIDFWREEGTDRYKKAVGWVMPRGPWTYEKPVAVLIDGVCASACEHFVSGAEATGRMLLVGTPTDGSGGGPKSVSLPSGAVVRISRAISIRACGIVFEGHGIPPHIEVGSEPQKGGDPALKETLRALEGWIRSGHIAFPQRFQILN